MGNEKYEASIESGPPEDGGHTWGGLEAHL